MELVHERAAVKAEAAPAPIGPASGSLPLETVIRPGSRWPAVDVQELLAYRGLFYFLVWRDIKVRYAQTVLGVGWAILQPVLAMVVFTIIFGNFASIPSDGIPYPLFSLGALVLWTYFSTALNGASSSLINHTNLLTKVYFPRIMIPLAPVLAGMVDFAIAFLILLAMMVAYGVVPAASAVVLPLFVLVALLSAAGVGLFLAALNVQYRDVKYVTPFLVQVWMYASPIVYPMSMVPEQYRHLYALNPMAGAIDGFRSTLLGTGAVDWSTLGISLLSAGLLFLAGAVYFRRMEQVFADVA
jgi:lipopolysaccharide transport system permease protein